MNLALQAPVLLPADPSQAARELADAAGAGVRVLPCGTRVRGGPGAPATRADRLLSSAAMRDVVAWEPGDQTVTVRTGLPVSELATLLATRGQWLPVCSAPGSVGGLLATAAEGACDLLHGPLRDRVLGATVALADGTLARGRGRVVKNVAGYDLPRLLVGSLGTLGLIVEATFRVQPLSPARAGLAATFATLDAAWAAARALAEGPLEPVLLALGAPPGAPVRLLFGVEGGQAGTAARCAAARGMLEGRAPLAIESLDAPAVALAIAALDEPRGAVVVQACAAVTDLLATLTRAGAAGVGAAPRLDVRPGTGTAFLEWDTPPAAPALAATLLALRATGHAVVWRAPPALASTWQQVWGPAPADLALMKRVKAALDPAGVLAAGRFVGGL